MFCSLCYLFLLWLVSTSTLASASVILKNRSSNSLILERIETHLAKSAISGHLDKNDWNYWGPHGERYWEKTFKNCKGRYQSPINIDTRHIVYIDEMQLAFINYDINFESANLINTGHGVKLAPANSSRQIQCFVSGSALDDEIYRFLQLHFHWRNSHYSGSEHAINDRKYTLEMHMVHQNIKYDRTKKKPNSAESSEFKASPDAFMVIAIFLNETDTHNPVMDPIINNFDRIVRMHSEYPILEPVRLGRFLPPNLNNFYRYSGSYTTPSCDEVVTWIIFPEPLNIDRRQVQRFNELLAKQLHLQASSPTGPRSRSRRNHTTTRVMSQLVDENFGYFRHIHEVGSRRIYAPKSSSSVTRFCPNLAVYLTLTIVIATTTHHQLFYV